MTFTCQERTSIRLLQGDRLRSALVLLLLSILYHGIVHTCLQSIYICFAKKRPDNNLQHIVYSIEYVYSLRKLLLLLRSFAL